MRRYLIWSGIAVVILAVLAGSAYLISTRVFGSRASFEIVLELHSDTLVRKGIPPNQHVLIFKEPYQWRHTWNMSQKIQNTEVCDGRTLLSTTIFPGQSPKLERYDIAKIEEKLGVKQGRTMLMSFKGVPLLLVDPNGSRWDYPQLNKPTGDLKPAADELMDDVMTRAYTQDLKKDLSLKLWYGKEDGLLRRMVMTAGKERTWITVKKVTIGPSLRLGEGFSTAVPLGQQVTDKTAEFISLTEGAAKKAAARP